MGKKISGNKRRRFGVGESSEPWNAADHAIRQAKHMRKSEKEEVRQKRSALLTRDSKEKREEGRLRLHIKRVQRQIEKLRERLQAWDDDEEKRLEKEEQEEERKRLEESNPGTKKKKGRKGPETWKLKGPARPAWQVYDFDTRFVDPHIKAHEEAKKKAQRTRNIFALYKGQFGEKSNKSIPQPQCREFLSLLMQLGNLSLQANQLKTARQAFLECMELDSPQLPITPARCQLMRMYMEANRPDSARRLWERLPANDSSVWIRYSAALIEYVSWKLLNEEGSSQVTAERFLARAIKANVFCAYYLGFFEIFNKVMDYVDDIEDAHEDRPLEECIEYCNSEQMGAWQGTDGALEWVRQVIVKRHSRNADSDGELSPGDLEWRGKLEKIKRDFEENEKAHKDEASADDDSADETSESDETVADLGMFAGMFETAMEMLEDSGKLRKVTS